MNYSRTKDLLRKIFQNTPIWTFFFILYRTYFIPAETTIQWYHFSRAVHRSASLFIFFWNGSLVRVREKKSKKSKKSKRDDRSKKEKKKEIKKRWKKKEKKKRKKRWKRDESEMRCPNGSCPIAPSHCFALFNHTFFSALVRPCLANDWWPRLRPIVHSARARTEHKKLQPANRGRVQTRPYRDTTAV